MKHLLTLVLLSGLLTAFGFIGCSDEQTGDPEDEAFISPDGQHDANSVEIGIFDSIGVLELVNENTDYTMSIEKLESTLKNSVEDGGVGLTSGNLALAADNIIAYRKGDDKTIGTADDREFSTIQELDAIPYVGQEAWDLLKAYAIKNGYVQYDLIPPNRFGGTYEIAGTCVDSSTENPKYKSISIKSTIKVQGGNHGLYVIIGKKDDKGYCGYAEGDDIARQLVKDYIVLPVESNLPHHLNGEISIDPLHDAVIELNQIQARFWTLIQENYSCTLTIDWASPPEDTAFVVDDGVSDTNGQVISMFDSAGVRELLNEGTTNEELDALQDTLINKVGLKDDYEITAKNIIAYRKGDDGVVDSSDELFDTLGELDNIPFVDLAIWNLLKQYALTNGYMLYDLLPPSEINTNVPLKITCLDDDPSTSTPSPTIKITGGNHGLLLHLSKVGCNYGTTRPDCAFNCGYILDEQYFDFSHNDGNVLNVSNNNITWNITLNQQDGIKIEIESDASHSGYDIILED